MLDQTASLTSALADRDQAIGEVIKNLNTVLDTTVKHQQQFDQTVQDFEKLITGLKNREDPIAGSVANISDAAGTISDLLADNRPLLQSTTTYLEGLQQLSEPAHGLMSGVGPGVVVVVRQMVYDGLAGRSAGVQTKVCLV